ncbi:VOC family protein [Myxococcota bacterium]|nr:VOC family protein [Myxococcota bacterium]
MSSRQRLNHFFLELPDHDAVGWACERIQEKRIPIAHEVGVHPNDNLSTFYVITPSGFQAEIGAEGRLVEAPEPVLTHRGIARWGHRMPAARKLRMVPTVARAAVGQLKRHFAS